jgi:hypothetical protein
MACCEGGFPQQITRQEWDGSWRAIPSPRTWTEIKIAWKAHCLASTEKAGMTWEQYRDDIVANNWWAGTLTGDSA